MTTEEGELMSRTTIGASLALVVSLAAGLVLIVQAANAVSANVGVGFTAPSIAGFPGDFSGGTAFLSGGGAYDPATASNTDPESAFVHSNGGFRCLADVHQGPLQGCLQGEGVRWDTDGLLQSTGFKCTGRATEAKKTAVTDAHTEVLVSDFYRAGDGNDASFKNVQVIVADHDLAPDIDGVQNVWIQQVGCGTADVNFGS
jgi:hypothetical protein